jgi:hypothetical protein
MTILAEPTPELDRLRALLWEKFPSTPAAAARNAVRRLEYAAAHPASDPKPKRVPRPAHQTVVPAASYTNIRSLARLLTREAGAFNVALATVYNTTTRPPAAAALSFRNVEVLMRPTTPSGAWPAGFSAAVMLAALRVLLRSGNRPAYYQLDRPEVLWPRLAHHVAALLLPIPGMRETLYTLAQRSRTAVGPLLAQYLRDHPEQPATHAGTVPPLQP